MSIRVQGVAVASPFRILREQAGLSAEDMSEAICVRLETLQALEVSRWYESTLGLPVVQELLSRVGCVSALLLEVPGAELEGGIVWADAQMELQNAFNGLCYKA